jgi:EmrB/QacA subfamily drug resistance transporter
MESSRVGNSRLKNLLIIGVLSLALAIIILDSTILNVSFSYILKDLHTDIKSLQWVITAYSLTIAALTITGGRMGDLFGRKKMFILGAVLFAIGSFIASISTSVNQMIIGESIIEGIGAALMMPATASLLASTFQGPARAMAMGVWGGVAGAASAIGPVIGGYLTTHYNWRWGFRINIFVVALLILGSMVIKEYRDERDKPRLDYVGVILSSLGLLSLVFGIIESSTYGWIKAKEIFEIAGHRIDLGSTSIVLPALIIALVLLVGFVIWELLTEKKGKTPLVSMKIFANRQLSSAVSTVMITALGQAGMLFAVPIFFQAVRGLDAYSTGLAIMPASLTALIIAPTTALISRKVSPKLLIQLGLLAIAGGMFWIYKVINVDATAHDFLPAMIVFGAGIGMMMAQTNNVIMSSVAVYQAGEVSGVSNTMRQLGSTLGSAIIGAVMLTALTQNLSDGIKNSPVIPSQIKSSISQTVGSQSSSIEFYGATNLPKTLPPAVTSEITRVIHQSTSDSNKKALLYADGFMLLSFLISFFLPSKKVIMASMAMPQKQASGK